MVTADGCDRIELHTVQLVKRFDLRLRLQELMSHECAPNIGFRQFDRAIHYEK
jgi:hypothetical protein